MHGAGAAIGFTILTLLHIVVGELVPKSLAIQRPEAVARRTSYPLRIFYWLAYPPLRALNAFSNFVLRLTGLPPLENAEGALSLEELRLLVRASLKEDEDGGSKQREVVERVLRSTDRPIRNVMVPRVDMVTLSLDANWETCIEQVRKHGYSRYPVTETGDPDHVAGYLYVKDLIFAKQHPPEGLRALRRDALFVPETKTVGDLLNDFQSARAQIAIVVDEYGGTAGLVTLEDVVEELVGEIDDEHDVETQRGIEKQPDGSVTVDGRIPLDEIELEGLHITDDDPHDTVGAYVIASLGRLAQPGDSVRMGAWLLVVDQVRRRRVTRVTLRPRRPTPQPPEPTPSRS